MSTINFLLLLLLGAIWGTSFMLLRVAVPDIGPLMTAFLRALLGGIAIYAYARMRGIDFRWKANARTYLVVGLFNTSIPFALFAWGALHIPSSYMATVHALAPIFTGMFAYLLLKEGLSIERMAGFVIGIIGVAVLVGIGPIGVTPMVIMGVLACIGAVICYGFAATYTRMKAAGMPPLAIATGSQILASLAFLPLALLDLPHAWSNAAPPSLLAVAILGVMCTGIAYGIFFHLIAAEGASKAITVTFLVPATASIWAWLFLGEPVTIGMVTGIAVVLCATALSLGLLGKWRGALRAGSGV